MDIVIAKIKKSSANEVWVVLTEFTGDLRLDLREYFHVGPAGFKPTRKGVSIPTAQIPGLRDALDALAAATEIGTVATINRSQRTEIRAGLRKFEAHTYAELRVFVPGPTPDAPWRPTPKGFTLKPSLIPLLVDAIGDVEDFIDASDEQRTVDAKVHKTGAEGGVAGSGSRGDEQ
jgi:hypothetical protein